MNSASITRTFEKVGPFKLQSLLFLQFLRKKKRQLYILRAYYHITHGVNYKICQSVVLILEVIAMSDSFIYFISYIN